MSMRERYENEMTKLRVSKSANVRLFASALDEAVGFLDDFTNSERRDPTSYIHAADAVDEAMELYLSSALFDGIRGKQGHITVSAEIAERMIGLTSKLYRDLLDLQPSSLRNGLEESTRSVSA